MVGDHVERVTTRVENSRDLVAGEERGGATTEIDRVDGRVRLRRAGDLGDEGVDVTPLHRLVEQAAVEVAVVADRGAEGDVEVEAQHCEHITGLGGSAASWGSLAPLARGTRRFAPRETRASLRSALERRQKKRQQFCK